MNRLCYPARELPSNRPLCRLHAAANKSLIAIGESATPIGISGEISSPQ